MTVDTNRLNIPSGKSIRMVRRTWATVVISHLGTSVCSTLRCLSAGVLLGWRDGIAIGALQRHLNGYSRVYHKLKHPSWLRRCHDNVGTRFNFSRLTNG